MSCLNRDKVFCSSEKTLGENSHIRVREDMAQTYTFKLRGDPEEKFKQVQELAKGKGVTLSGDSTAATFSGRVTGSYTRSGNTVTVVLTDKFFLASWAGIESTIRDWLES